MSFSADSVERVASHYDHRRKETLTERREHPVLRLKNYNNLLKRALLTEAFSRIAYNELDYVTIVDVCGGRGGDLQKYIQLCKGVGKRLCYLLIDVSEGEVAEARRRFLKLTQQDASVFVRAEFIVADVLQLDSAQNQIQKSVLDAFATRAQIVSCQFALHYLCSTDEKLQNFWRSCSRFVAPANCVFVVSAPAQQRVIEWQRAQANNQYCQIEFISPTSYRFTLAGAIDGCVEHLVPPADNLCKSAGQSGCRLALCANATGDQLANCSTSTGFLSPAARAVLLEASMQPLSQAEFQVVCLYEFSLFLIALQSNALLGNNSYATKTNIDTDTSFATETQPTEKVDAFESTESFPEKAPKRAKKCKAETISASETTTLLQENAPRRSSRLLKIDHKKV